MTSDLIPSLQKALDCYFDPYERRRILNTIKNHYKINLPRSHFTLPYFESLTRSHFDIEGILYSRDYEESEFCPIYALKKR